MGGTFAAIPFPLFSILEVPGQRGRVRVARYPPLQVLHPLLLAPPAVPRPLLQPKLADVQHHPRIVTPPGGEDGAADVEHPRDGRAVVARLAQEADLAVLEVKAQAAEVLVGVAAEGE